MEAALTWQFGSVSHRVPTGRLARAPSFSGPLPLAPPPRAPRVAPGVAACELPPLGARFSAGSAMVGGGVHAWADHSARFVVNERGQRLFVQLWRPWGEAARPRRGGWLGRLVGRLVGGRANTGVKGVVYVVHGLNDHSNKYQKVARAWVENGYAVVAHDCHGHGRSDGFRAYTSSMQHYVDDARRTIEDTERRLPKRLAALPKFLLAHSLGGAVAIHLAQEAPEGQFAGLMLTAPAVRVFPKPLLKLFAPVIATFAPLLPVQRLKFDRRRRRGKVPRVAPGDYDAHEDPLVVRSPVRARVGYEVLKSCEKIMSEADRFRVPVFVAHSKQDRVTNAKGTIEFHDRIASCDKTVRLYDGKVHDLLAERRDTVMADMVAWADKRLRR